MDDYRKLGRGEHSGKERKRMSRANRGHLQRTAVVEREPKKVVDQVLVFAVWTPDPVLIGGGEFAPIVVDDRQPDQVWTLFGDLDPDQRPTLPVIPFHGVNALSEDPGHDWTWSTAHGDHPATLRYQTRAMDQSCWILLEYCEK